MPFGIGGNLKHGVSARDAFIWPAPRDGLYYDKAASQSNNALYRTIRNQTWADGVNSWADATINNWASVTDGYFQQKQFSDIVSSQISFTASTGVIASASSAVDLSVIPANSMFTVSGAAEALNNATKYAHPTTLATTSALTITDYGLPLLLGLTDEAAGNAVTISKDLAASYQGYNRVSFPTPVRRLRAYVSWPATVTGADTLVFIFDDSGFDFHDAIHCQVGRGGMQIDTLGESGVAGTAQNLGVTGSALGDGWYGISWIANTFIAWLPDGSKVWVPAEDTPDIALTLSDASAGVGRTITAASAAFRDPSDIGTVITEGAGSATITAIADTTHATATITADFAGVNVAGTAWTRKRIIANFCSDRMHCVFQTQGNVKAREVHADEHYFSFY